MLAELFSGANGGVRHYFAESGACGPPPSLTSALGLIVVNRIAFISIVAFAMFTADVGSYFLLVRAGPIDMQGGAWFSIDEYRAAAKPGLFDPHKFYRLANNLDRKLIRPSSWSGTYTFADIISGLQIGPNHQTGANGRQPSRPETNRTPAATASRRSP